MIYKLLVVYIWMACSYACMWDSETLIQERTKFPSVLELITGKFPRHSPVFYEWRIENRLQKIKDNPNDISLYDDLAVSYDKIGNHRRAIEVMLNKEKIKPSLYETYANLGTFYIHSKQYRKGLTFIDKAISINRNAHFGREIYQKCVVEYLLSKSSKGKIQFPLLNSPRSIRAEIPQEKKIDGFVAFIKEKPEMRFDRKAALKGILGMMRFGNHTSPVLLEILAHLLIEDLRDDDGALLACRALLQASFVVEDISIKETYSTLAKHCISGYENPESVFKFEKKRFAQELRNANIWYQQICSDEKQWIENGDDVEKKFIAKYYQDVVSVTIPEENIWPLSPRRYYVIPQSNVAFPSRDLTLSQLFCSFNHRGEMLYLNTPQKNILARKLVSLTSVSNDKKSQIEQIIHSSHRPWCDNNNAGFLDYLLVTKLSSFRISKSLSWQNQQFTFTPQDVLVHWGGGKLFQGKWLRDEFYAQPEENLRNTVIFAQFLNFICCDTIKEVQLWDIPVAIQTMQQLLKYFLSNNFHVKVEKLLRLKNSTELTFIDSFDLFHGLAIPQWLDTEVSVDDKHTLHVPMSEYCYRFTVWHTKFGKVSAILCKDTNNTLSWYPDIYSTPVWQCLQIIQEVNGKGCYGWLNDCLELDFNPFEPLAKDITSLKARKIIVDALPYLDLDDIPFPQMVKNFRNMGIYLRRKEDVRDTVSSITPVFRENFFQKAKIPQHNFTYDFSGIPNIPTLWELRSIASNDPRNILRILKGLMLKKNENYINSAHEALQKFGDDSIPVFLWLSSHTSTKFRDTVFYSLYKSNWQPGTVTGCRPYPGMSWQKTVILKLIGSLDDENFSPEAVHLLVRSGRKATAELLEVYSELSANKKKKALDILSKIKDAQEHTVKQLETEGSNKK